MLNVFSRINDHFLLKISLLGYIVFKLMTFNLWFSFYRDFPIVSSVNFLTLENGIWSDVLSILSLFILIVSIFKLKRPLLILFLFSEILLACIDMMRWQPIVFQILLTVVGYVFYKKQFKTILLLILSATYLFSGLHKLNLRFINVVWCNSILIDLLDVSKEYALLKIVKGIGFIIPLAEIISGILILTRWRKFGFYIIFLTHLFILGYVGPLGLNYNSAIWPWNVLMIIYAILFMRNKLKINLKWTISQFIWLIILFILPVLNLANLYYPYFSFDLYSGSKSFLYIKYEYNDKIDMHHYAKQVGTSTTYEVDVNMWSFKNLNVPTTHSNFLYKRIMSSLKGNLDATYTTFEASKYPYKEREVLDLSHKKTPSD